MKKLNITGIRILKFANGSARRVEMISISDTIPVGNLEEYRKEKERWVKEKYGDMYNCDLRYSEQF